MMLVDRLYVSPIDGWPALKTPSVVRPVLNEPNRWIAPHGHSVCVPQVPSGWGVNPIPYWHGSRVAFEWPYDRMADKIAQFVYDVCSRYGADPLCVGIEIGAFGQWGEWTTHIYHLYRGQNWPMLYSDETVRAVFDAVRRANPMTPVFVRSLGGVPWDPTSIAIGHELTSNVYEDVFGHPNADALRQHDSKYSKSDSLYGVEMHPSLQQELLKNPGRAFSMLREKNVYYVCKPYCVPMDKTQKSNLAKFMDMVAYTEEQK